MLYRTTQFVCFLAVLSLVFHGHRISSTSRTELTESLQVSQKQAPILDASQSETSNSKNTAMSDELPITPSRPPNSHWRHQAQMLSPVGYYSPATLAPLPCSGNRS